MKSKLVRRYLMAGLLVWLPVWATIVVLKFLIELLDNTLSLLPKAYQPEQLFGFHIPGSGVIFSLTILLVTGLFASNILGAQLVNLGEKLLDRIPLVRSIYYAVKQVLQTLFSSNSQSFRKVLLIEYPRRGTWSVAFQTGGVNKEMETKVGEPMLTVFVPTTPNPTSGFLILVPKDDAIELDMGIDEALRMVISLGVVQPGVSIPKSENTTEITQ